MRNFSSIIFTIFNSANGYALLYQACVIAVCIGYNERRCRFNYGFASEKRKRSCLKIKSDSFVFFFCFVGHAPLFLLNHNDNRMCDKSLIVFSYPINGNLYH